MIAGPEADLRALITRIAPAQSRLVGSLRRWMRKRLPTAHEMVYEYRDAVVISYSPSGRGHEAVLSIRAAQAGVRLYFGKRQRPARSRRTVAGKGEPDPLDQPRARIRPRPAGNRAVN